MGATLGILLGILTTSKALRVILLGGFSKPLNLFPELLQVVSKHPASCPSALPMAAYFPVEDLDKYTWIPMFMKLDSPRVFGERHLRKQRGGTLLKCLPTENFLAEASKPSTSAHQALTSSLDCLFPGVATVSEGSLLKITFFNSALQTFSTE